MKSIKSLSCLLFLLFACALLFKFYYSSSLSPVNPFNSQKIIFQVKSGESVKSITANLKNKKLINNAFTFYLYLRQNNLDSKIKAGKFLLAPDLTGPEIADYLTGSASGDLIITVLEGYRIKDIDVRLTELNLIRSRELVSYTLNYNFSASKYDFLKTEKSLEGYLFPDTYYLSPSDFNLTSFVDLLLKNFQKKIKGLNLPSDKNLHDIIIMASILEKEVNTTKDLPIVSGILWKRLDNNWPLQADATLLYEKDNNLITKKDLESNSPYNTRKFKELPPAAIGNPGLAAIKAAIFPQNSSYWFYLTDSNGNVVYAETNEQHNENKKKYL